MFSFGSCLEVAGKTNVKLDNDLYGYKKFSCFLLSNSHILKIQSCGEGQLSIRSIAPKVLQPAEDATGITSGTVTNNGDLDRDISSKRNSRDSSCSGLEKKTPLPPNPKVNGGEILKDLRELKKALDTSPHVEKANKSDVVREPLRKLKESQNQVEEPLKKVSDPLPFVEMANNAEKNPISEVGFLKVIWIKWFGAKDSGSEEKSSGKPDKYDTSKRSSEKIKETKKNSVDLTSQSASLIGLDSKSSSTHEVIVDENSARSWEANDDKSSRGPGFFNKIIKWCKFFSSPKSDSASELSSDILSIIEGENKEQHIFSTESFWNNMVAFVDTPRGSNVITQSKTRKEMAQNLRKDGPSVLRYLIESDLLHLVDLLILDKKWVKEYSSQKFPFKIIRPAEKGSVSNTLNSHNSNSLRFIFLDTQSLSDSKKLPEHGEKRNQDVSHTGVSPPAIDKNLSKSRDQILADCEKLVEHIVKEYPSGFNIGGFRKLFLDRYGYSLDVQKLGYQKLVNLLQIMPRVTIESNHITPELPSGKVQKSSGVEFACNNGPQNNGGGTIAKSDSDFSATSRKYDNLDSKWKELWPVCHTSPKRNDMESSSRKLKEETIGQVNHKYETLSDDSFSGSDDESLSSTGSEGQGKPSIKGEDSLIQILDSWQLSKGVDNRKALMESYERKQRPPTSYSFVSDKVVDNKNKLVDGILGSLKKSNEMSAKSKIQA